MNNKILTQVVVLGSGPGGYSAAFRCSDLGLKVVLVERHHNIGGVCLNVGCIPSKTLLHISKIIEESSHFYKEGIFLNELKINLEKIRSWKIRVVDYLASNLYAISKKREIDIIKGYGRFIDANTLKVENNRKVTEINFDNAIIASGSIPKEFPIISYKNDLIWNSTDALSLPFVPKRLLIIGAGVIGLEIATIYHRFGSKVDIIEISNRVLSLKDKNISKFFTKKISSYCNIILESKVTKINIDRNVVYVETENKNNVVERKTYDAVLISVGRIPNTKILDVHKAGINIDENGFIIVNNRMQTSVSNIYAIGDVIGNPMLAHKASYEGHIAAEVIYGKNRFFDAKVIPFVVYTNPEIGWVGMTEEEAKNNNINCESSVFPWSASGKAISSGYQDGITKLVFNRENKKIIGGIVVGSNASELLGEISLAIEMNCDVEDISLTIHAHPTLYETVGLASEIFSGTITDLPNTKIGDLLL